MAENDVHVRAELARATSKPLLFKTLLLALGSIEASRELHPARFECLCMGARVAVFMVLCVTPADIEGLARIGVACLQLLLSEAGPRFTPDIWDIIVGSVVRLFDSSTPLELLACRRYFLDYQPFSDSEGSSDDEVCIAVFY